MNIREAAAKFKTDEDCLTYIEQMRWPDGIVRCPVCGTDKPAKVQRKATSRNKRGWFYLCSEKSCRHQFSPTSGTIFHDTHLPLIVWFHAVALMLNAKKGISAKQLQRDLGIGGYKTAWYLNHRIREAMADANAPKLGGIIEIDETYIGGKQIGKGRVLRKETSMKPCSTSAKSTYGVWTTTFTRTIESAFSLLKHGIVGNFHKVSIKHLQPYLN